MSNREALIIAKGDKQLLKYLGGLYELTSTHALGYALCVDGKLYIRYMGIHNPANIFLFRALYPGTYKCLVIMGLWQELR